MAGKTEATGGSGKPDKVNNFVMVALVVIVTILLLLVVGGVIAASALSDGVGETQTSIGDLGKKVTAEIAGLKKWANDTFVSKDELNKELDKRLAKKPAIAAKGNGGQHKDTSLKLSQSKPTAMAQRSSSSRQEQKQTFQGPPPASACAGKWVRSGGGYDCVVPEQRVPTAAARPSVDDSAKVVAEACAPLGIISNGRGGWKCRAEPVAVKVAPTAANPPVDDFAKVAAEACAPLGIISNGQGGWKCRHEPETDRQQTAAMPKLYSLTEEPKPAYSSNQSLLWGGIGCITSLAFGGGGSGCVRGAAASGLGDAAGQYIAGSNGGHVGGAIGTIGSAAVAKKRIAPAIGGAGVPINPPVAGAPFAPPL